MSISNISVIDPVLSASYVEDDPSNTLIEKFQGFWSRLGIPRPKVALDPASVIPLSRHLRAAFDITTGCEADAVLLTSERQVAALENFRNSSGLRLVPVINLSARRSFVANIDFDFRNTQSWVDTANCIRTFSQRRALLSRRFHQPRSSAMALLAYVFVSGEDLKPIRCSQSRYFFQYRGFADPRQAILIADAMVERGLLERSFVDRQQECVSCRSHRMVVREECPKCRSANLSEVNLIHHYACAWEAPDSDFRQGTALVCPKCMKQLRHYGKDYDKPGVVQICGRCRATTSEPSIGFVCQDCETQVDGDAAKTVDIFSYALTDRAIALLSNTEEARTERILNSGIAAFPERLQSEIHKRATEMGPQARYLVAHIHYGSRSEVVRNRGEATFASLRSLFLDNLQGALATAGSIYSSPDNDYVLLSGFDPDRLEQDTGDLLDACDAVLSDSLVPSLRLAWASAYVR